MKSRIKRLRVGIRHFYFIVVVLALLSIIAPTSMGAPSITRREVSPRNGTPDDTFLFLVTYVDTDNTPAKYVKLVVGDKEYALTPVNPADDNYTDGKDYIVRTKLPEGTHIFYFHANNGSAETTSVASTIRIKSEDAFTHLDVAYSLLFATFILLIPICYGLYLMKKIAKNMDKRK